MMERLDRIATYLDDPCLVAKFQRFCGLSFDKDSSNPIRLNNMYSPAVVSNSSIIFRDDDDPSKTCHYDQNGALVSDEYQNSDNCIRRLSPDSNSTTKTTGIMEIDATTSKLIHQNGDVPSKSASSKEVSNNTSQLPYKIHYKSLYYLFSFGAALGDELFYTTFFPFIIWNLDFFVSRKVVVMWWITLYLGQATKDIVKRPRPMSPPVIKLEARYELEYGMPSTHAMVGTCIPFTLLFLLSDRYEFPFLNGLLIATCWTMLVSLSRIYLGMHSILDIIIGILYVCIILPVIYPYLQDFDHFSVTHPVAPVLTIGIPFLLCLCYPAVDKWNTARRDTTLLIGVGAGISVGSWLCYQHGLAVDSTIVPFPVQLPGLTTIALSVLRLFIGVPIMLVTAELLRHSIRYLMRKVFAINIKDPEIKKLQLYELTDSFLPFLFVAINVTYGIPMIFTALGINRPSYYAELLPPTSA